jgi:hypothetical protein
VESCAAPRPGTVLAITTRGTAYSTRQQLIAA